MVTPRLPTVTQTWQLDVNNAAARDINQTDNNRKTMFAIKNALVSFSSNPWTVNSSSDGASAGASDLWIDSDDLIWSTGNHSWIVLTKPTTGSQILISCDRSGTNDILMSWSPGGLYTGGTISVDPTATDQVTIQISGTWNGNLSTYYSWVHVWHSSDGRRTRVVVANDAGHPRLFWILDEVDPIPDNWATTPEVVCIFEHGTNALSWFSTLDDVPTFNNVAKSWDDTNEFDIGLFTLGFDSCPSGFGGTNFMSRQEFGSTGNKLNDDEPYPMAPVGIFSRETGFRGAHGILADMYVGHEDRAGATYPDSTTEKLWAQFGDIILPWTGGDAIPISDPTVTETIIDESTNSNDGTPTNMENSDFVLDTAGGSFSTKSTLLGGSEYVVIGDVSPLQFERTDPFSISIWIKTSTVSTRIPISKLDATAPNAGYEIFLLSTGEIGFQLINTVSTNSMTMYTTSTGWIDGAWHHVVATWDGDVAGGAAGANIYIDGSPEATTVTLDSLTGSILTTTPLHIGARETGLTWLGNIDDVAIYDKELTSGEVTTIYNGGAPINLGPGGVTSFSGNLVGYWLMGDDYPTVTQSEEAVNGVLIGFGATADAGATQTYVMVGIDTGNPSQPAYHFWTVTGSPDSTGALATGPDAPPFGGPLTNIYVSAYYEVV